MKEDEPNRADYWRFPLNEPIYSSSEVFVFKCISSLPICFVARHVHTQSLREVAQRYNVVPTIALEHTHSRW